MTEMTDTAAPKTILKTFKTVNVYRECGVVVDVRHNIVTVSVEGEAVSAWANGVSIEVTQAHRLIEGAESLALIEEKRSEPLPADALGTHGAWELRKRLEWCGLTWGQAVTFVSTVLGRDLPCIAADTLTAEEGYRVRLAIETRLTRQSSRYVNTLTPSGAAHI